MGREAKAERMIGVEHILLALIKRRKMFQPG